MDSLKNVKDCSLGAFFSPRAVALVGATEKEGSVGHAVLRNLISQSFGGTVFPVNPKRGSVLGIKAYPSISAIPEKVDLAVVVTPAPTVPAIIAECASVGAKGAIVISAGFKENGREGAELERQILGHARQGGMRIIGPNCFGVMIPPLGLNATFASRIALAGNVAFISQSGALGTAILDWSYRENIGFSAFISVGSMLDVGWGELIDYLGNDPRTRSILIYMESVGDAQAFLSAAREVAMTKPIIVIKAGRTGEAAKAAASHTGALTGSDDVLDAAFRRCGVLRVNSIAELFYMAEVLDKQPCPHGPRLAILTNAGGPAVLATDALLSSGGKLAELSRETIQSLNQILPTHWSRHNPVDVLGDADAERYGKTLDLMAKDPGADGLLVILTPQAMTQPTETAERLKAYAKSEDKPILASWMGGHAIAAGDLILSQAGIPTFPYPDTAARVFHLMWKHKDNLRALYETPRFPNDRSDNVPDRKRVSEIIQTARKQGRTLLTEPESKQALSAYRLPVPEIHVAITAEEAVRIASRMGYPVVLKIYSETITHKTEVGGIRLDLRNAQAVRHAYRTIENSARKKAGPAAFQGVTVQPMIKGEGYELILGSSVDPQFGPVLLFGAGGQLAEVFKDKTLALPPLTTTLARRMIEQTLIFRALQGVRDRPPVDLAVLEQILVRFSCLVIEQPWIKEMDINPLFASSRQLTALDARIVLHDPSIPQERLPKPVIRPYPSQYITPWKLKDGSSAVIRPIRPEDEPLLVRFHKTLSEQSVRLRYLHWIHLSQRISHERLARVCFNDYDREIALVIEQKTENRRRGEILAVGRLSKLHDSKTAKFALVVGDRWQGNGLGMKLMKSLLHVAREEKLERLTAEIPPESHEMRKICERLNFGLAHEKGDSVIKAEIRL